MALSPFRFGRGWLDTAAARVDLLAGMSDLAFLTPASPINLQTLLELASSTACADDVAPPHRVDLARLFGAVATLDRAGPDNLAVFLDSDDPADLAATRAGACFVAREHVGNVPSKTIALVTARPAEAMRRALTLLYPAGIATAGPVFERCGIDPAAIVHSDARLEQDVTINPGAVIGPHVEIGGGTTIGANVVVGAGVRIGRGCTVDSLVSIRAALIGDRVTIHAGARIGLGAKLGGRLGPRLGRVIVQDDVEIGANAVIERGRLGDTIIGERARIGTLVVIEADTLVGRLETRDGDRRFSSPKM